MKKTTLLISLPLIATLTACGADLPVNSSPEPAATSTPEQATATLLPETPPAFPSLDGPAFDLSVDLQPVEVTGTYLFAEGPATAPDGSVFFSDINAGRIYKWSMDGSVAVFIEGLNLPNGLMFDQSGNLVACEGGNGRLISIDQQGKVSVLVDKYNGVRFNEPNDLWIDSQGGIYFTDPAYQTAVIQDGEHVYYLSPDGSQVTRVISDMVRPNGIVGTADGSTLYVADHGAGQTYIYEINADGTLANKRLFVPTGSDGMTLDTEGNLYLTTSNRVQVYNAFGDHLKDIPTRENPTNVTFAGDNGQVLFITARTAVYTVQSSVINSGGEGMFIPDSNASGFTLTSPDIGPDGLLPVEYTCDGSASTLPLSWSGAPSGTVSYAVIMHHVAPDNVIKWYWVLYDIPAGVTNLPRNTTGIGILGTNSVNDRIGYEPPCSQGPGPKTYTFMIYALSAEPQVSVPESQVTRQVLLDAIQGITLASAQMDVTYSRP